MKMSLNKNRILVFFFSFLITSTMNVYAAPPTGKHFDRVIFVIFENTNYSDAIKQPFFKELADKGAHFSNFSAITHPSQGNYVALTSGSLNGVKDDKNYDLNSGNIADLLEAKELTWKVYAEAYPGGCFKGSASNGYVRKHNPFISYVNIQNNPIRCANIVEAAQFDSDVENGKLPNYIFYVPDLKNDGHNTSVEYADKWYQKNFSKYLNSTRFMDKTVIISTFDESRSLLSKNQIYTSIVGPSVKPIVVTDTLDIYSLLSLVEDNWSLGNLGKHDFTATPVPNIWKEKK